MRKIAPVLGLIILLAASLTGETAARAQEFSADLRVSKTGETGTTQSGKVYVAGNLIRLETPELPDGFFLIDTSARLALFLRPERGLMMDAKETSLLTQLLVPVVPQQPCVRWQDMAVMAGSADKGGQWRCTRRDDGAGTGHAILHFEALSPRNARVQIWIDPIHRFPVRVETDTGSIVTLDNFRDQRPPVDLFTIPTGLRKFEPTQLIDRIKQSDVWVEPPK